MIVTHSRRADPAERQIVLGNMQEGVVDRDTTGHHAIHNPLGHRLVIGERVEGERARTGDDRRHHFVEVGVADHRQDWPKNLASHDVRVGGRVQNEMRRELPGCRIPRRTWQQRDDGCAA